MRFGLQSYHNAHNLGNEIQVLAARAFLPRVDCILVSDFWDDTLARSNESIAVIMNGWYAHRPEGWPPPDNVVPYLVSIHISEHAIEGWSKLGIAPPAYFLGECSEYLKQWGPVGARDLYTLDLLQKNGIPSYFSGCLTLTLGKTKNGNRNDYVACVDLPEQALLEVRRRTSRPIVALTHFDTTGDTEDRLAKAQTLLDTYQSAHCVITTRLHCAMPCLALETPVLLLDEAPDQYRFSGLNLLVRHCSTAQFTSSRGHFDLEYPLPNDLDYLKYRNSLMADTELFVKRASVLAQKCARNGELSLRMRYNSLWAHYGELERENHKLKVQIGKTEISR
jgi:hypothetical protein